MIKNGSGFKVQGSRLNKSVHRKLNRRMSSVECRMSKGGFASLSLFFKIDRRQMTDIPDSNRPTQRAMPYAFCPMPIISYHSF